MGREARLEHWRVGGDIAGSGHLCTKQCPKVPACTHGDYNVRGDDSWGELGFWSSQCERRVCLPASQEGNPRETWLQGSFLHPSCCTLGARLAKPAALFSTCSSGSPVFPGLPDTEVSWLEQQGEPRNQMSERALCTVVLLSSSAASASCKQAAQLMFDLPVACSLVGPARQQQQQPWQTVLTPRGDRMPSPGILAAFLVGKHCPRNWYTSLCPRIWGRNLGS